MDESGVSLKFTIFGELAEWVLGVSALGSVNKWWQLVCVPLATRAWLSPFLPKWRVAHSSLPGTWFVVQLFRGVIGTRLCVCACVRVCVCVCVLDQKGKSFIIEAWLNSVWSYVQWAIHP